MCSAVIKEFRKTKRVAVCLLVIYYTFTFSNGHCAEIPQQDDEVAGRKQLQFLQKGEK